MSSLDEWQAFADNEDEPRAQLIGDLADQIRARFGANKHAAVWLTEETEWDRPGCDCCGDDADVHIVIDCGHDQARIRSGWDDPAERLAVWLDEPRRQAEQAAAKAAEQAVHRERSAEFDQTVLRPIADAMQQVEAEGYGNDQEWHDKLMNKLGVQGY
ncbi:hypothetical protein [Nocardia sp. NPDC049707]|uniref:hypothetical protein n=1 Tax=Nocardia sp. NPDC049707 TaxID=3154735 RepID=UPI0034290F2F